MDKYLSTPEVQLAFRQFTASTCTLDVALVKTCRSFWLHCNMVKNQYFLVVPYVKLVIQNNNRNTLQSVHTFLSVSY